MYWMSISQMYTKERFFFLCVYLLVIHLNVKTAEKISKKYLGKYYGRMTKTWPNLVFCYNTITIEKLYYFKFLIYKIIINCLSTIIQKYLIKLVIF